MRSTLHGPDTYLLKSKKPHIVGLIERSKNMTEDEIKLLNEKPDVIKGLLLIKQKEMQKDALVRAEAIADMMIAALKK